MIHSCNTLEDSTNEKTVNQYPSNVSQAVPIRLLRFSILFGFTDLKVSGTFVIFDDPFA